jgi:hypothetical protein
VHEGRCLAAHDLIPFVHSLWKRFGENIVLRPSSPAQALAQGRRQPRLSMSVDLLLGRTSGRFGRSLPRMPEIDVQVLDLLDQHQDRTTGGREFVTSRLAEAFAPPPQHFELLFVETRRLRVRSRLRHSCSPERIDGH